MIQTEGMQGNLRVCHQRHLSVVAAAMPVRVEALLARSMHDARFRELHKTLPRNPDVRLRRTRKARTRLDP